MKSSSPPKFHALNAKGRIASLRERGVLSDADEKLLLGGGQTLTGPRAEQMIENVIGVFGLPLAVAPGFLIDSISRTVPLVVEEPSIVAALSSAAKLTAAHGGFVTRAQEALLVGQIQLVDMPELEAAAAQMRAAHEILLSEANRVGASMVTRGGGVRSIETRTLPAEDGRPAMLVVHLVVDTCDAMGANFVNTLCEAMSPLCERITQGRASLRILSNLTDQALVWAEVRLPPKALGQGPQGIAIRDAIVLAAQFAEADPYRAVTHNKGIMNGIDAVALAVGNDWRALEAAAHGYASREGVYSPLSSWTVDADGNLVGTLCMPLKVGTRGGNFEVNPAVALNLRILKVTHAQELARVMAAVGLAQNLSALRALATQGIQAGHMRLHARSVAASANVPAIHFDAVVAKLIADGDIKVWRAKELLLGLNTPPQKQEASEASITGRVGRGIGFGKVLLTGEHAVVYGARALAVPVSLTTAATVTQGRAGAGARLLIPSWDIDVHLKTDKAIGTLTRSLALILEGLSAGSEDLVISVDVGVPRAMGLGGSAALAVSVVRALVDYLDRAFQEADVIALAFEAEKVAHGTPSGVDNALAVLGCPLLFIRGTPPVIEPLVLKESCTLVVALGHHESLTADTVARVRRAWRQSPKLYEALFDAIDTVSGQAQKALEEGDLLALGELMNINHGLLSSLAVSTSELEQMIGIARMAGALGAKLTGGGGGGAVVALVSDDGTRVQAALQEAGFRAIILSVEAKKNTNVAQGGI